MQCHVKYGSAVTRRGYDTIGDAAWLSDWSEQAWGCPTFWYGSQALSAWFSHLPHDIDVRLGREIVQRSRQRQEGLPLAYTQNIDRDSNDTSYRRRYSAVEEPVPKEVLGRNLGIPQRC